MASCLKCIANFFLVWIFNTFKLSWLFASRASLSCRFTLFIISLQYDSNWMFWLHYSQYNIPSRVSPMLHNSLPFRFKALSHRKCNILQKPSSISISSLQEQNGASIMVRMVCCYINSKWSIMFLPGNRSLNGIISIPYANI